MAKTAKQLEIELKASKREIARLESNISDLPSTVEREVAGRVLEAQEHTFQERVANAVRSALTRLLDEEETSLNAQLLLNVSNGVQLENLPTAIAVTREAINRLKDITAKATGLTLNLPLRKF